MTKKQIETIIQENMQKIYLYCVKRLENTVAAQDVASDIILEMLRSYRRIQSDEAVYGYMWRVANNLCKNYWRESAKERHTEIPNDFEGACCISPEENMLKAEEIMLLRRELSFLRERYRRIMISYYIGGRTCKEIANQYNLSVSNVKQYLFEGRKKLKEGMDMVREYGKLSYAPEKFTMNFWGNSSSGYWELFERKLPGNLIIAAYESPKTLEELSLEMGVGVPYLEDEVAILEKMGLLVRKGKAYQSNMVLYDEQWRKAVYDKAVELLYPKLEKVKQLVDKGVEYLAETDYCYEAAVERKQEPEEVAALSALLKNRFVSVKDGKLLPEFAVISYEDYKMVKGKLGEGINLLAELIGRHRDMAGEELRKKTPAVIAEANEVGAIVSMWSMMEGMIALALEDGFVTKGNGQNLSAFYFRTKF